MVFKTGQPYTLPNNTEVRVKKTLNGVCCYEDAVEEGKHDLDCDNHEVNRELRLRRQVPQVPINVIVAEAMEGPAWAFPDELDPEQNPSYIF